MLEPGFAHPPVRRRSATAPLLLALGLLLCGDALAQRSKDRRSEAQAREAAELAATSGTMEELRRLMEANQLTEMRTTYNGNYGASLLFLPESLQYYVVLFRDRQFWRVIKTDSIEGAERSYRTFVGQTEELAQAYLDTIRLDAGKRFTERMVALNEQRLQNLQRELDMQRQQGQQVSSALQQARQQAVDLSSGLRASHEELDAINQRIKTLQALQADPDFLLPTAPPASETAATQGSAAGKSP
jgi:hypothetical protein